MGTTTTTMASGAARRSIRATAPLARWRTVDLLTVAFLGAAFGIAYWGWDIAYNGPVTALNIAYQPLTGIFAGPWFMAGVVGGLVVRRPGAALFAEVVAALMSMVPGTEWGATVLMSGILQGLGAELVFAVLGYSTFGVVAAVVAGAASAPLEWLFETFTVPSWVSSIPGVGDVAGAGAWASAWPLGDKLVYLAAMASSGLVVAGGVGWLLTRALARAGALRAFPAGQELRESRAV